MRYFLADPEHIESILQPDGDGYYIVLPNKESVVEVLSWSTHQVPDGTYIGIGRNLSGVVAIHIPKP